MAAGSRRSPCRWTWPVRPAIPTSAAMGAGCCSRPAAKARWRCIARHCPPMAGWALRRPWPAMAGAGKSAGRP
ncbi:hypothetical protein G6F35_018614 [Rhizopus arrhizus]|nr:hypothetical protein G6F35_018614 [Rhizopus arrhizus]